MLTELVQTNDLGTNTHWGPEYDQYIPIIDQINLFGKKFESQGLPDLKNHYVNIRGSFSDKFSQQRATVQSELEAADKIQDVHKRTLAKQKARFSEQTLLKDEQQELDRLLPEVFALTREVTKKLTGMAHYDVQLLAGIGLHEGSIAEMGTGEGKTLAATLDAVLNSVSGKTTHIMTTSNYLAQRDAGWMGSIYDALGLRVAAIGDKNESYIYSPTHFNSNHQDNRLLHLQQTTRADAYQTDVVYGKSDEFVFDLLRDQNRAVGTEPVQGGHDFLIVDEADNILIDNARNPILISRKKSMPQEDKHILLNAARAVSQMRLGEHFNVFPEENALEPTDVGINLGASMMGLQDGDAFFGTVQEDATTGKMNVNFTERQNMLAYDWLLTCLKAKYLLTEGIDYIVDTEGVFLLDKSGHKKPKSTRLELGLHEALEALHDLPISDQTDTVANLTTYPMYLDRYERVSGMTGTADTELFETIYKLPVLEVPPRLESKLTIEPPQIYQTTKEKLSAIHARIITEHKNGRPILVIDPDVNTADWIARQLRSMQLDVTLLTAHNEEEEAMIMRGAGRLNAITVSTSLAGRGVDIPLGGADVDDQQKGEVEKLAGLLVVQTSCPLTKREARQAAGRAGRQGAPGTAATYMSYTDHVVEAATKPETLYRVLARRPKPSAAALIYDKIQFAELQTSADRQNTDRLRHNIRLNNVLTAQANAYYASRERVLRSDIDYLVDQLLLDEVKYQITNTGQITDSLKSFVVRESSQVEESAPHQFLINEPLRNQLIQNFSPEELRKIMILVANSYWQEHLEYISRFKRDLPLEKSAPGTNMYVDFVQETSDQFKSMNDAIRRTILDLLMMPEEERKKIIQFD